MSNIVGEYFEIDWPQMARNALKIEATGNHENYFTDNTTLNKNCWILGQYWHSPASALAGPCTRRPVHWPALVFVLDSGKYIHKNITHSWRTRGLPIQSRPILTTFFLKSIEMYEFNLPSFIFTNLEIRSPNSDFDILTSLF